MIKFLNYKLRISVGLRVEGYKIILFRFLENETALFWWIGNILSKSRRQLWNIKIITGVHLSLYLHGGVFKFSCGSFVFVSSHGDRFQVILY